MVVHLAPEIEAKLARSAANLGANSQELLQELLTRNFEEEEPLVEAITVGEEALARGEYLTHEQAGSRLRRFLQERR